MAEPKYPRYNSITVQFYQKTDVQNIEIDKIMYMKMNDRFHLSNKTFCKLALRTLKTRSNATVKLDFLKDTIYKYTS